MKPAVTIGAVLLAACSAVAVGAPAPAPTAVPEAEPFYMGAGAKGWRNEGQIIRPVAPHPPPPQYAPGGRFQRYNNNKRDAAPEAEADPFYWKYPRFRLRGKRDAMPEADAAAEAEADPFYWKYPRFRLRGKRDAMPHPDAAADAAAEAEAEAFYWKYPRFRLRGKRDAMPEAEADAHAGAAAEAEAEAFYWKYPRFRLRGKRDAMPHPDAAADAAVEAEAEAFYWKYPRFRLRGKRDQMPQEMTDVMEFEEGDHLILEEKPICVGDDCPTDPNAVPEPEKEPATEDKVEWTKTTETEEKKQ